MAVLPPCGGCQDRTTGPDRRPCHSTCERYQAFRAAQIKETEAHDKYWKVHGAVMEGKRRMQAVHEWEVHGTFKERHRENGQNGRLGASDRWAGKYSPSTPDGQEGRKTAAKRRNSEGRAAA